MFDLLFMYEAIYHLRWGWQGLLIISIFGFVFQVAYEYAFPEYSHVFVHIRAIFDEAVGLSWSSCARPDCLLIAC